LARQPNKPGALLKGQLKQLMPTFGA